MSKQEQLFDAALKLFIEYGFHATPTSKIAKEAGVANGTLFNYFPTKEQLINELYLKIKVHLITFLSDGLENKETIRQKIEHLWRRYIKWGTTDRDKFVFLCHFHNSPFIHSVSMQEAVKGFQFVFDILEEGISEKTLIDIDVQLMTEFVFSSAKTVINYYPTTTKKVTNDDLETYFKVLWRGIVNI